MEQYIANFLILCSFSLIFIIITLIVGIRIISHYFTEDSIIFFLIGLAWIGMSFPWLPETFKLFFILFNAPIGGDALIILYLIINIMSGPLFLIIWIVGINRLSSIKKNYKRLILYATVILTILFEVLIVIFLFTNKDFIVAGLIPELYSVNWNLFIQLFQIILIIIVLVTGIIFARESLGSENKEIHLKGKFLIIAFISFVGGAVLEVFFTIRTLPGLIFKIISRLILMSSSIEFFIGYIMPERFKRFFIKEPL